MNSIDRSVVSANTPSSYQRPTKRCQPASRPDGNSATNIFEIGRPSSTSGSVSSSTGVLVDVELESRSGAEWLGATRVRDEAVADPERPVRGDDRWRRGAWEDEQSLSGIREISLQRQCDDEGGHAALLSGEGRGHHRPSVTRTFKNGSRRKPGIATGRGPCEDRCSLVMEGYMAEPGKQGVELRLLGPLEVLRDGTASRSAGRSRVRCSRRSHSSRAASSPSTA